MPKIKNNIFHLLLNVQEHQDPMRKVSDLYLKYIYIWLKFPPSNQHYITNEEGLKNWNVVGTCFTKNELLVHEFWGTGIFRSPKFFKLLLINYRWCWKKLPNTAKEVSLNVLDFTKLWNSSINISVFLVIRSWWNYWYWPKVTWHEKAAKYQQHNFG